MPETRVQDEQGNTHVFPDGSTPEMIASALGVKPPTSPMSPTSQALSSLTSGKPNLPGMIQRDESNARLAGVPGGSPNTPPATDTMGKIAGAGIGAAALGVPGVLPFLGAQAVNVAKAIPPLAMMGGINWLRQKIPAIPASAEYLPMFMRFGGPKARPGGDATRENVPYAGEEEPTIKPGGEPDATKENAPYAGETIETPAEQQARAFGFKQGRLVLSPQEAQSEDQIQAIAKERASKRGMRYAAGVKPKGTMGQISQ